MNEEQLDDLKQFIGATVSQTEHRLRDELGSDIGSVRQELADLRQEVRDGFAGVGEAIEEFGKHTDEQLSDHERRISALEDAA